MRWRQRYTHGVAEALLPLALLTLACTFAAPSGRIAGSAAGTFTSSSVGGDACGVGFTAKSDGDGLPALNPAGTAGKGQIGAFLGGVSTSSLATVLMLIATAVKSTVNGWLTPTGFPALLCPSTSTVNAPWQALTFAAGMPTLQLPSACTVAE